MSAQTLALLTVVFSVLTLVAFVVRVYTRGSRPTMHKGGQNVKQTTNRPPDAKPLGRIGRD